MNISNETIKKLSELYFFGFYDQFMNEVQPEEASELIIGSSKTGDFVDYIGKTIKSTKKETTLEYILSKLSSDRVYQSFACTFEKLLNCRGISCYATTYGIGIASIYNSCFSELKTEVETKLNELGIAFETEYSSARWVFRYKISKSVSNIQKIKRIIEH